MSKFLTLKQAAKKFNPAIDVDDVLKMALDGELKLSVNFINPMYYARTGTFYRLSEQHESIFYPDYSSFEKLIGVYDLAMIGNEKLNVENKLRQVSDEKEIDYDKSLLSSLGCIVVDEYGQHYQLLQFVCDEDDWLGYGGVKDANGNIHILEPDDFENYEIRERLPLKGLDFVVRENAINEFEQPKPQQTNSENLTRPSTDDLEQQPNQTKSQKKLKPLERDISEEMLLIYEITKCYNVQYLNDLSAIKAWNHIVSSDFKSDLIKSIADNKKSIVLNIERTFEKGAFLRKYNSRFKE